MYTGMYKKFPEVLVKIEKKTDGQTHMFRFDGLKDQ